MGISTSVHSFSDFADTELKKKTQYVYTDVSESQETINQRSLKQAECNGNESSWLKSILATKCFAHILPKKHGFRMRRFIKTAQQTVLLCKVICLILFYCIKSPVSFSCYAHKDATHHFRGPLLFRHV